MGSVACPLRDAHHIFEGRHLGGRDTWNFHVIRIYGIKIYEGLPRFKILTVHRWLYGGGSCLEVVVVVNKRSGG